MGCFWVWFNVHTFNLESGRLYKAGGFSHRADRRVKELVAEGWVYGWLSRFKLIRLRRISLATLPRYGWMGGRDRYLYIRYLYIIDCLRQGVAFAPKVINAP